MPKGKEERKKNKTRPESDISPSRYRLLHHDLVPVQRTRRPHRLRRRVLQLGWRLRRRDRLRRRPHQRGRRPPGVPVAVHHRGHHHPAQRLPAPLLPPGLPSPRALAERVRQALRRGQAEGARRRIQQGPREPAGDPGDLLQPEDAHALHRLCKPPFFLFPPSCSRPLSSIKGETSTQFDPNS